MLIDLIAGVERARLADIPAGPPPGVRADQRGAWSGDAEALAAALRARIEGEVRFDDGSRALYATDSSNYRQVPIGVVVPRSADDVVATVEVARAFGAPILARGGGTSLAGECCNVAVVLDCSKYLNRVLEINAEEGWARVEPGIVLDDLRAAAAPYGLWFGPDPATHSHNTHRRDDRQQLLRDARADGRQDRGEHLRAGDPDLRRPAHDGRRNAATRSSRASAPRTAAGARSTAGCATCATEYADQIRARFPNIPRLVSGYPLQQLLPENKFNVARALVGTECTLALVLSAKVKLIPNPHQRVSWCSASTTSTRPATTCPTSTSTSRSRSKGSTTS